MILYIVMEKHRKIIYSLEDGNCPYSEKWIFYSKGDGSLPEKEKN